MDIYFKDLRPEYNVIDIRDNTSYNFDHYINSVNIPMNSLLNNPDKYLNKNDIYYIYCSSGIRSKKTCSLLSMLGYKVVNVIDGFGK